MAKISQISLDSTSRGETARAIRLATLVRIGMSQDTSKRIKTISHKTITIR